MLQLLAKVLLKPFYLVGSIEMDNETKYDDDDMPALQVMNDKEGKDEGDSNADYNDKEEKDSLGVLDDNKREKLINNTKAVCTTLNKVSLSAFSVTFLPLHSHPLLL